MVVRSGSGVTSPMEVLCLGMAVSDIVVRGWTAPPPSGETAVVEEVSVSVGGDALNQAIVLAGLGHRVGLMTLVGRDPSGRLILTRAAESGVDTSLVAETEELATTTSVVLVEPSGERSFVSHRGTTADQCGPQHFGRIELPEGLKVLSIGSLLTSRALDEEVLPQLLSAAKARGIATVADMVNDREGVTFADLAPVLEHLDILVPSLSEATRFTGLDDPEAAGRVFLEHGVSRVVVKCGVDGAVLVTRDSATWVPAHQVPTVDTTGSGDNFMAGTISGLLEGMALDEALARGAVVAALSVQVSGATGARITTTSVNEFIREQSVV